MNIIIFFGVFLIVYAIVVLALTFLDYGTGETEQFTQNTIDPEIASRIEARMTLYQDSRQALADDVAKLILDKHFPDIVRKQEK